MKKISLITFLFLSLVFTSCTEKDDTAQIDYVGFQESSIFGVEPSATPTTKAVKIYANTTSTVDRVIKLKVLLTEVVGGVTRTITTLVPSDYVVPATVTIPANSLVGSFNVTISNTNLNSRKDLAIAFDSNSNGFYQSKRVILTAERICLFNRVNFQLVLDRYGSEITWDIKRGTTVVASGGPYMDGTANALQAPLDFPLCLPAGAYTINVYDSFGDGMVTSATVVGSYSIKFGTTTVAGSGSFTNVSTRSFILN